MENRLWPRSDSKPTSNPRPNKSRLRYAAKVSRVIELFMSSKLLYNLKLWSPPRHMQPIPKRYSRNCIYTADYAGLPRKNIAADERTAVDPGCAKLRQSMLGRGSRSFTM